MACHVFHFLFNAKTWSIFDFIKTIHDQAQFSNSGGMYYSAHWSIIYQVTAVSETVFTRNMWVLPHKTRTRLHMKNQEIPGTSMLLTNLNCVILVEMHPWYNAFEDTNITCRCLTYFSLILDLSLNCQVPSGYRRNEVRVHYERVFGARGPSQ